MAYEMKIPATDVPVVRFHAWNLQDAINKGIARIRMLYKIGMIKDTKLVFEIGEMERINAPWVQICLSPMDL